jgi:ADP-ribosylglycohydrolase
MTRIAVDPERIRSAWEGRISGCQLGKPVELLSMVQGRDSLLAYLEDVGALPLRDYIPLKEKTLVAATAPRSCKGRLSRSEPDDDINYTVLGLILLERHGLNLSTTDVARAWVRLLPAGETFTAERAAYRTLLERAHDHFPHGAEPGFDLAECAQNEWSEWIGAQIRSDLYGWVCPGQPGLAAELARRDACLSHTGDGVNGAMFIAALGAAIPTSESLDVALDIASAKVPKNSGVAEAVSLARSLVRSPDAVEQLHRHYGDLSPVHTLNNLALVVWGLLAGEDDFSATIGDVVSAGWDTDCNGATVGGLWGLRGRPIPRQWTAPWQGRIAVSLAGVGELRLEDLVDRTVAVAHSIAEGAREAAD